MGRRKEKDTGFGYEPLKAKITKTSDGFPVDLATARRGYGPTVQRSGEDGWFWIFATPTSAVNIRHRGLRAVGSQVTTWIPPQSEIVVDPAERALELTTPIVGSQAHTELMIEETWGRAS